MTPLATAKKRKQNPTKYMVGGVVVLALLGYMIYGNMQNNLVFFVTPSEYLAEPTKFSGQTLRLGGLVKNPQYNAQTLELNFNIYDGQSMKVFYQGALPDLFKANQGVVVEGQMQGEMFVGKTLLVKHSEEYRAPKEGEKIDVRKLLQDTQ